jgi:hypothetical protein
MKHGARQQSSVFDWCVPSPQTAEYAIVSGMLHADVSDTISKKSMVHKKTSETKLHNWRDKIQTQVVA